MLGKTFVWALIGCLVASNSVYGSDTPLLDAYCSASLHGSEGRVVDLTEVEEAVTLAAVVLAISSGDRSAIHTLPNADGAQNLWKCGFEDPMTLHLKSISSEYGLPAPRGTSGGKALVRPLTPELSAKDTCDAGQLTPRGVQQHVALGRHLEDAYTDFVHEVGSARPVGVYARAKDHTRCLASGATLLSQLFSARIWRELQVYVEEREEAEVMDGVGLKPSCKRLDANGHEKVLEGPCNKAAQSTREQQAHYLAHQRPAALYAHLESLFGSEILQRSIVEIADVVRARWCHNLTLPCGPGGCLSADQAEAVARESEAYYCSLFAGSEGGAAGSRLAMFPVLQEITDRLEGSIDGVGAAKFSLLSGDDTAIAPLLGALGIYDCRVPAYAAHVAFELWRDASSNSYVRVLYDGNLVTPQIAFCARRELCPLQQFVRGVHNLVSEEEGFDFEQVCEVNDVSKDNLKQEL